MKLLIDNALSPNIAKGLLDAGFNAVHVREIGLGAAKDSSIMERALIDDMVIVSADTDFGTLLALNDSTKPSFVLFRRTDKRPSSLLNVLLNVLDKVKDDLDKGAIVVIEDTRIRIRRLP